MKEDSELDQEVIKALSSDTRTEIMKSLKEKDRTPTSLSNKIGKHKSTIVEHLKVLKSADLVEKDQVEGRKRVLYSLTRKGRNIASRSSISLKIILGISSLGLLSGSGALWNHFSSVRTLKGGAEIMAEAADTGASQTIPYFLYIGIALIILGGIGTIYSIWRIRRK